MEQGMATLSLQVGYAHGFVLLECLGSLFAG